MKRKVWLFFILWLIINFGLLPAQSHAVNLLNIEAVKSKIDLMLTSKELGYSIIKISEPFENIVAVAIEPSYREFPNIIIFKYDPNSADYKLVFETLSFGIQDKPTTKLDFHTRGLAVDMGYDKQTNVFGSPDNEKIINIGNQHNFIVIPYQEFTHMHSLGGATQKYTIDKTGYYDFALKLIGEVYKKYPKDCTMYDTPSLLDMQLSYKNGNYIIAGTTDNNQLWQASFAGVDQNNRYLLNKKIEVAKAKN